MSLVRIESRFEKVELFAYLNGVQPFVVHGPLIISLNILQGSIFISTLLFFIFLQKLVTTVFIIYNAANYKKFYKFKPLYRQNKKKYNMIKVWLG
jgi:hypothetical protein